MKGTNEMEETSLTKEQMSRIMFHSDLLDKNFKDWDELVKEEKAFNKAEKERAESEKRKADALNAVKEAYDSYHEAIERKKRLLKKEDEAIVEAFDKYLDLLAEYEEHYGERSNCVWWDEVCDDSMLKKSFTIKNSLTDNEESKTHAGASNEERNDACDDNDGVNRLIADIAKLLGDDNKDIKIMKIFY